MTEDQPDTLDAARGDSSPRIPPSAAGLPEPYGARVVVEPTLHALEPRRFLTRLLEDLASSCLISGASVIGHLKCLLRAPGGVLACNLTSVRSGATCTAPPGGGEPTGALVPGDSARLDVAILVYGLPAATIDTLVRQALATLLEPLAVVWSIAGSCDMPREMP